MKKYTKKKSNKNKKPKLRIRIFSSNSSSNSNHIHIAYPKVESTRKICELNFSGFSCASIFFRVAFFLFTSSPSSGWQMKKIVNNSRISKTSTHVLRAKNSTRKKTREHSRKGIETFCAPCFFRNYIFACVCAGTLEKKQGIKCCENRRKTATTKNHIHRYP